jgi:hypothetical protein
MRRAHLPFSDILRKLRGQSRFKAALFFLPRILLSNRHQLFLIKVCEVDMPFDVSAEGLVVRMRGGAYVRWLGSKCRKWQTAVSNCIDLD